MAGLRANLFCLKEGENRRFDSIANKNSMFFLLFKIFFFFENITSHVLAPKSSVEPFQGGVLPHVACHRALDILHPPLRAQ